MVANLDPVRGRLLVATPDLQDPNFQATVILLVDHDEEGTLGVVLNRPSDLAVDEAMSSPPGVDGLGWADVTDIPPVVFVGGPVRPNAILALARVPTVASAERWQAVADGVGVVSLGEGPITDVGDVIALRIFAGYAGWGPGQLDDEIRQGSWFVVEADPDDGFSADPADLWHRVLRRQGGVFTTATAEPGMN